MAAIRHSLQPASHPLIRRGALFFLAICLQQLVGELLVFIRFAAGWLLREDKVTVKVFSGQQPQPIVFLILLVTYRSSQSSGEQTLCLLIVFDPQNRTDSDHISKIEKICFL